MLINVLLRGTDGIGGEFLHNLVRIKIEQIEAIKTIIVSDITIFCNDRMHKFLYFQFVLYFSLTSMYVLFTKKSLVS